MQQSRSFVPTRAEGLKRLESFLPASGRIYADQRNFDRGAEKRDAVSTLSPYLRHRLLTEEEVLAAVIKRQGAPAAEKFITELFWRTYWKGYLEMRPTILERMVSRVRQQTEGLERGGLGAAHEAAIQGRTGIDAFDHFARELVETGYLHNHARMWFASIWIFSLRLPWELGADFFMRHLLDGDPASNTLSWRWVAGLHTRGKNYVAQRDNINRYTDGRFFPKGLIKVAAPLDETAMDAQIPIPAAAEAPQKPFALLLCDDDLGIESLPVSPALVRQVTVINTASRRSPNPVSESVIGFVEEAAGDMLVRAQSVFPNCELAGAVFSPDEAPQVIERILGSGVRDVVIPAVPVGAGRVIMDALASGLSQQGVTIHRIRRAYDSLAWPHAARGFFQMKDKIPSILAALGLTPDATDIFGPRERQPIVMRQR